MILNGIYVILWRLRMFSSKKLLYLAVASSLISQTQYLISAQEHKDSQATTRRYEQQTDLEQVTKIIENNYQHLYYTKQKIDKEEATIILIENCLHDQMKTAWVLIFEDKVAGFIVFQQKYFYGGKFSLANEFTGYIELLAVDQEHRGKGFGKMLMDRAQEELKKAGQTSFVLNCHNQESFGFYKKCGFQLLNKNPQPGQWTTWYKEDTSSWQASFKRFRRSLSSLVTSKPVTAMLGGMISGLALYLCYSRLPKNNCISRLWRSA